MFPSAWEAHLITSIPSGAAQTPSPVFWSWSPSWLLILYLWRLDEYFPWKLWELIKFIICLISHWSYYFIPKAHLTSYFLHSNPIIPLATPNGIARIMLNASFSWVVCIDPECYWFVSLWFALITSFFFLSSFTSQVHLLSSLYWHV